MFTTLFLPLVVCFNSVAPSWYRRYQNNICIYILKNKSLKPSTGMACIGMSPIVHELTYIAYREHYRILFPPRIKMRSCFKRPVLHSHSWSFMHKLRTPRGPTKNINKKKASPQGRLGIVHFLILLSNTHN